jgi:hypothetical protein
MVQLTPAQQTLFLAAVMEMVEDLSNHAEIRSSFRVKGVKGHPGVLEMSWARDGRATFHYGSEKQPGDAHIVWRRIGKHRILQDP